MTLEAGRVIAIFSGQMLKRLGVFRLRPGSSLLAMTCDAPIRPDIGLLDRCCWNERRSRLLLAVYRGRLQRRGLDEGTCRANDAHHDCSWNHSPVKSVQHGPALFSPCRHYANVNNANALLRQDAIEFNVRGFGRQISYSGKMSYLQYSYGRREWRKIFDLLDRFKI